MLAREAAPTSANLHVSFNTQDELEHAARLFRCTAEGVPAFETPCDFGVRPCQLDGVPCAPGRATPRETCLSQAPCARGLLNASGATNGHLRARDAPRWRRLPTGGAGFAFLNDTKGVLMSYGTRLCGRGGRGATAPRAPRLQEPCVVRNEPAHG